MPRGSLSLRSCVSGSLPPVLQAQLASELQTRPSVPFAVILWCCGLLQKSWNEREPGAPPRASQLLRFFTVFGSAPGRAEAHGKIQTALPLNEPPAQKCLAEGHQRRERKVVCILTPVSDGLFKISFHSYQCFSVFSYIEALVIRT